ncbi:hypothetical protein [Sinorhizobium meliloti]|nr:hypothetical protein [Sinorhizobium meliloti]MDE4596045.1 hypothetical protein [Sinorhizobium meliloti]
MSEFPEGVMKLASETVKENFECGEPWSKSIARAIMADRSARSTPPAAANSPITPTVNKNGSGTNSETPGKT